MLPGQGDKANRKKALKALLLFGVWLLIVLVVFSRGPIAQDPAYHDFADTKMVFGIPNAFNVLSNFAFLFAALYGCFVLYGGSGVFITKTEEMAYWTLFASLVVVSFGSAYYHVVPNTGTLFWDRLPMTITFMSLVSIIIAEKIDETLGRRMLLPLCVVGVASVAWWSFTEYHPDFAADLRYYVVVQASPMGLAPIIVWLYPARYSHAVYIYLCSAFYLASKVVEFFDHAVYMLSFQYISGHSLKHLLAACGVAFLPRMLTSRRMLKVD